LRRAHPAQPERKRRRQKNESNRLPGTARCLRQDDSFGRSGTATETRRLQETGEDDRWRRGGGPDVGKRCPGETRSDSVGQSAEVATYTPIAPGPEAWAREREEPEAKAAHANSAVPGRDCKGLGSVAELAVGSSLVYWLFDRSWGRFARWSEFLAAVSWSGNRRNWPEREKAQGTLRQRGPEPLLSQAVSHGPRPAPSYYSPDELDQVKQTKGTRANQRINNGLNV
jgi:hypothetical protein